MNNLIRTTITLPTDLLKLSKILAVREGKTMSGLVRELLSEKVEIKKLSSPVEEIISLAGTVKSDSPMFKNPRQYIRLQRQISDEHRQISH